MTRRREVFFKKELTEKAIRIMGKDALDNLFNTNL